MTKSTSRLAILAVPAVLLAAAWLYAGPINPPPGPITSTGKTLAEVEPRTAINASNTPGDADSLYKITQPGSYYLTGNITGVVGKHGIKISADGVTLDLSGFDLVGVPGMGAFDGVNSPGTTSTAVLNGSIRNWGDEGIGLGISSNNSRVEGVRVSGNGGYGIHVSMASTISNCAAHANGGVGINAGYRCTINNCSATSNMSFGISAASVSKITNCTVIGNVNYGILAGGDCLVTECVVSDNSGHGVYGGTGATISNCSATYNSNTGIYASYGSTVTNCSAANNSLNGIFAIDGCTVVHCEAFSNDGCGIGTGNNCTVTACSASANTLIGITATDGCTITNCTATNNLTRGISANNGCQITGCLTRNNQYDGITVNFSSTVSGNTCNGDGVAAGIQGGIHIVGQANRIEANNVSYADHGLLVDSSSNFIVRNTVRGCTINWDIAANNVYGPILDRTSPASAAVSGNSAASALGSTDPNANFTN